MKRFGWRDISGTQWAVFVTATLGYGLYYVCRLSLSVVKAPLIADGVLSEAQVGLVGSGLFYVYAAGKLANGFFADRVSLRRLFSLGLLLTALINLLLGWFSVFGVFLILWGLNGWVQSMGAPACVVGLTRWFETRQRGTFYGLWSSSHNVGEGITFLLTTSIVAIYGWRAGFFAAGLAGLIGAMLIWLLYPDPPALAAVQNTPNSVGPDQWQVLRSPVVWSIALASACMYVTRYAVNSWGMFYFQNAQGRTPVEAGKLVALSSVCGVLGTVSSGLISDVLFKGDRFKPAIGFGVLNIASLALMLWAPHDWHWAASTAMIGFGLAIGALVCFLGGLMAVDAVQRQAAGAALGIVGIASYIGAGTQDILSGWLIGRGRTGTAAMANYDFTAVKWSWLAAAVGSLLLTIAANWLRHRNGNSVLSGAGAS